MRSQPQPLVLGTTPAALPQQLATLDATLAVIDTPPHTAVTLPTITALATAPLLPCRPMAFDLAACPPRAPDVAAAAAALATHGVPVAPGRIGERRAYARLIHTMVIHTLSPDLGIDPCASA